ncbi:PREDICTED: rapid alkalinization factor 23-like [Ipomoea nil]|uniref:rapid alkalinization factor 23-like n=1 Tax=Ipomoea nil TaxID=35883 RepID=UPI000900A9E0|nr:PREDICTED: rapid alkalinization factor 23-like [Ipomoea nil]
MAVRKAQLSLLLLLLLLLVANLALSLVAQSSMNLDPASVAAAASGGGGAMDIDDGEEMMMDSESSRRVLFRTRFLSYSVLRKDQIPCGMKGPSYYFCHSHHPIRPYTRGCSRFTRCGGRGR